MSWIGDSSEGGSVVENGDEVVVSAAQQGIPFNVRRNNTTECFQFEIEIRELTGSVSVGLVTSDEFKPGWKTRGMFYNGNVTNGSASLMTGFGKYVAAGDTIGVRRCDNNNDMTEIQFLMNQTCLGTAFRLEHASCKTFYPCVHVSGTVTFVYTTVSTNLVEGNAAEENEEAATGYEGDWKLSTLRINGAAVVLPSNHPVILSLQGAPIPTKMSVKVANTFSGSIQSVRQGGDDSSGEPGALNITIGALLSTRMMPPPELQALERDISQAIPKLTTVSNLASGHLSMSGLGGPELTASRYRKVFEPLTKY